MHHSKKKPSSANGPALKGKEGVQKLEMKARKQRPVGTSKFSRHAVSPHTPSQTSLLQISQRPLPVSSYMLTSFPPRVKLRPLRSQDPHSERLGSTQPRSDLFRTERSSQNYGAVPNSHQHASPYNESAAFYGWVSDPEIDSDYFNTVCRQERILKSCSSLNEDTLHYGGSAAGDRIYYLSPENNSLQNRQFNSQPNGIFERDNCPSPNHQSCNPFSINSGYFWHSSPPNPRPVTHLSSRPLLQNGERRHKNKYILPATYTYESTESSEHNSQSQFPKDSGDSDRSPAFPVALRATTVGVSGLWVGPLVVLYWCNTWHLTEKLIFPDNPELFVWACVVIGYGVLFLATCLQTQIASLFQKIARPHIRFLLSHVYSYIMALACVFQWRGLWALLDYYTGITVNNASVSTAIAVSLMLLLRCYKSVLGPPTGIKPDIPLDGCFTIPTFFNVKPDSKFIVLDSLFTVFVVGSLLVSVWRGFWELLDLRLYPSDADKSAWWTLGISYGLFAVLSVCQAKLTTLSTYLDSVHWLLKLVLEDIVHLVQSIICITHWRGFWLLLDEHDPYRPQSLWVCHGIGYLLLAVTLASHNLMVRGSLKDGALPEGQGIELDVSYLTELSHLCGTKKQSDTQPTS